MLHNNGQQSEHEHKLTWLKFQMNLSVRFDRWQTPICGGGLECHVWSLERRNGQVFVEKARGIWMIYYVPAGVRQVRLASPAAAGRLPPELLLLLVVLLLLLLPPGSWSKGRSAWLVLLLLTVALLLLSMAATAAGDLLPPSLHPSRPGERPLFLPIGAPPPTTGGNLCNFMRK